MSQRELKFRAWIEADDAFNKRGMYGPFSLKDVYSGYEESGITCEQEPSIQEPQWNKLVIMQFTGLRDWHGKEIYEGDIIRNQDRIVTVQWYGCGFIAAGMKGAIRSEETNSSLMCNGEILGNIYEHPELTQEAR